MRLRLQSNAVLVQAPCKVNIYLEVLAKRPDGFHEIETLMASTGICDTLEFRPLPSSELLFECRWGTGYEAFGQALRRQQADSDLFGPLPADVDNLAWRAVDLLRQSSGISRGAHVRLVKRIPAAAGLGGASADAAAALLAANSGWELNWSIAQLGELAAQLGSDVPFFLASSAAICRGRGEQITEVTNLRRRPIVIVRPATGLSTPRVYSQCRPQSERANTVEYGIAGWNGPDVDVQRSLVNRLEDAARRVSPIIEILAKKMATCDLVASQMSGSGSSFVGVARTQRQARRIAGRLRCMGVGFAAATTCPGTT